MITEGKFNVPIYDYKVEVIVFDKIKEVIDKYPKYISEDILGCTIEYIGRPECVLVIPSNDLTTVIHELEHVKNLIWKTKGYTPHVDNDEPDAYLMGYLFKQVEKIIKKH